MVKGHHNTYAPRYEIKQFAQAVAYRNLLAMESQSPGNTEAKQMSARVSLKEIANRFASPLTEEHAWAVLYQLAQRFMRQTADRDNFERESRSNCLMGDQDRRLVLTLEGVLLSEDGEIEVKTIRKKPNWEGEIINY